MSSLRKRLLTAAACLGVAATALLGGSASAGPKTDATSSLIGGTPPAELTPIKYFAGLWSCDTITYPFGQPPVKGKLTGYGTFALGGRWFVWVLNEHRSPQNPDPTSSQWIWGWDAARQGFSAEWYDSKGLYNTQFSAGFNGNVLLFEGRNRLANGFSVPTRDKIIKTGQSTFTDEGTIEFGGQWVKVSDVSCRRA